MPLILGRLPEPTAGDGAVLRHTTQAQARRRVVVLRFAAFVEGRTGYAVQRHTSTVQGQTAWRVQRHTSRALGVQVSTGLAGAAQAGVHLLEGRAAVPIEATCILGKAVKASYEHTGDNETATVTIRGARETVPDTLVLDIIQNGVRGFTASLTVDKSQWEESTQEGVKMTTIRLYNATADTLNSKPLPPLTPWEINPRVQTAAQGMPLRAVGVNELIYRAANAVGVKLVLMGDQVFADEHWLESRRETTTEGRTLADLLSDTYGAAGCQILIRGAVVYVVPPGERLSDAQLTFTPCELRNFMRRKEGGQLPGRLDLSAADAQVPRLKLGAGEQPAPESDAAMSFIRRTPTGDGGETITTKYVQGGLLRQTQEVVLGRVEVKETVDDKEQTRVFDRVLISDVRTDYTYHPTAKEALIGQKTVKRSYGYTLGTKTEIRGVSGVMFAGFLTGGDLVGEEVEQVTQQWYENGPNQGYLRQRIAQGSQIANVQQKDAEEEPDKRGPVLAREYVTKTDYEEYTRFGDLWERSYGTMRGVSVPLFDTSSGEAVRLATRTGSTVRASELMENEPPKVAWPNLAAQNSDEGATEEMSVPQHSRFVLSGNGTAQVSRTFGMLRNRAKLPLLARWIAQSLAPRLRQEVQLNRAVGYLPGDGNLASLSLEIDTASRTRKISLTTLDFDRVSSVSEVPWPQPFGLSGVVVSRIGDTVQVQVLSGVSAGGTGTWREVSAYLTGDPPKRGDSVTVRLDGQGRYVVSQ